jgi:hypothetical protein
MNLKTTMMAAGAALALALMTTAPASAAPIPDGGVTVEDMVRFLQSKGYKAEVKSGTNGRYIASAAAGVNFDVYFYDCVRSRCASVQFEAGFDLTNGITTSKINEWNRDKRYLKAYVDSGSDPHVSMDANTSPARTYEGLADDFGVWTGTLPLFATFIGWN